MSIIATVTDYDVWHGEDVTIDMVIQNAMKNEEAVAKISLAMNCVCANALNGAIMTFFTFLDFVQVNKNTFAPLAADLCRLIDL